MAPANDDEHLSRIATLWTLVCEAHRSSEDVALPAQRQMLERYGGAVRRYLRGVLRDPEAADDLFQEFAIRFLHGKLRGANPERGRFRDFVKGVLFHLIADYRKRQRRQGKPLPEDHPDLAVSAPSLLDQDREFLSSWRDDLLARTWETLKRLDEENGQQFYAVLRFRADHPKMPSHEIAGKLSEHLGKPLSAAGVRQLLHRARERFADLLLEEVVQSLESPSPEMLEQELIHLNLLEYCKPALDRRADRQAEES